MSKFSPRANYQPQMVRRHISAGEFALRLTPQQRAVINFKRKRDAAAPKTLASGVFT